MYISRKLLPVLCAVSAIALLLTACGQKTSDTGGPTGTGTSALSIVPQVQVDVRGNKTPPEAISAAEDPAGTGQAVCSGTSLALIGALTGSDSSLLVSIRNGANLALDKHNKANPNCQVRLREFDTEGDPQKATQIAPQIVGDTSIIGLLGPTFSGEYKAIGQLLNDAGLASPTPSASNASLAENGWRTFFRGLANDGIQGPALAKYLTTTLNYKKICVVRDNSDYGAGLAKTISDSLGSVADSSCGAAIKKGDKDFSVTISKINAAKADAIFYAGYYPEAALLVQQLKSSGSTATLIGPDGVNDSQFITQAGNSAKGTILSCPCGPAPDTFKSEYRTMFKSEPGIYAVESYDLLTIMLKGIDEGKTNRPALLDFIKNYDGTGLARQYSWDPKGELTSEKIWIYNIT